MSLIKLPTSISFLIVNEFFQRISYHGLRAVISSYITEELDYSDALGKIIYHIFATLIYLFAIFGAIFADSYWGKFKTIFYMSLVHILGNVILVMSAAESCQFESNKLFLFGIALIAIGSGGISPCVLAFGGDQFKLPDKKLEMNTFFHLLYFVKNIVILLTSLITPLLAKRVYCFGKTSCYSLPFLLAAFLMIISVYIFVSGKPVYKIKRRRGNLLVQMSRCIGCAIINKYKSTHVTKDHWLDFAIEQHGKEMINDIKTFFQIFILYLPLALFWLLFEQLAASGISQASRMDGKIGNYEILPHQLVIANPLTVIIMIPLFVYVIYPASVKYRLLNRPLQRMAIGGILASGSYVITGIVAMSLESERPNWPLTNGTAEFRIFNVLPCNITFKLNEKEINLGRFAEYSVLKVIRNWTNIHGKYQYSISGCTDTQLNYIRIKRHKAITMLVKSKESPPVVIVYDITRASNGNPKVRTVVHGNFTPNANVTFYGNAGNTVLTHGLRDIDQRELPFPGIYTIEMGDFRTKQRFGRGGVYIVLVSARSIASAYVKNIAITKPYTFHMSVLLPQYVLTAAAEIMLSVTGLEFSYSQAPIRMKSVLQACWLFTFALGQPLGSILEGMWNFDKPSAMYFLCSAATFYTILVFIILSDKYKYVTQE